MAQADRDHNTSHATRFWLFQFTRDPIVRASFRPAQRDYGQTFAITNDLPNDVDFGDVKASDKRVSRMHPGGAAS
jgi:hypothetical protein